MSYQIYLPKDNVQAEETISRLVQEGVRLRNVRAVDWWIARSYLEGARTFDTINYEEGTISVGYYNDAGVLQFRYDEILTKFQTQIGRLMGLNLAPFVNKKGVSLDGLKKASVAQVALESIMPTEKVNKLKQDILAPFLTYGMIGLNVWVEDENSMGIEAVMPWELLPIPSDVTDSAAVRGVIRRRFVPKDWVEGLAILGKGIKRKLVDVESIRLPVGEMPSEKKAKFQGAIISSTVGSSSFSSVGLPSTNPPKEDKTQVDVLQFVEVWTFTSDGHLGEYLILAGMTNLKLLFREDYSTLRIYPPIKIIVDIQAGGFWGKSWVDTLIPINIELEYTIARVFQNMQDWDIYGIQYEPTTAGVPAEIKRGVDGLRRVRYEPDYTAPDNRAIPFNIAPANSGLLPVNVVNMGLSLLDRTANQPTELLSGKAPGRVDSSAGLGTLYEASGVPLLPSAKNIAMGVIGCYKAILGIAKRMWKDSKIVDVTHLDDTLAGIKFDAATGELKLAENAIPYPDEVEISVMSEVPMSKEQEKMELMEAFKLGIITPFEYRIAVRKRGLSLPVGNEIEWQNYRRAMLENLVLFGDGTIPGQVIVSERDQHPVHLQVLAAFMARPEFYLAASEVRDAFIQHYEAHEMGMGALPDQMPTPEGSAEAFMQGQQAQMEGQMGGGQMPVQGVE